MKPADASVLRPESRPPGPGQAPGQVGGGGGDRPASMTRFDRLKRAGDLKPKGPSGLPPSALPSFEIAESRLCAELGVGIDELRARREYFLCQGRHWDYVKKRVLLSAVGAEILRGTRNAVVPEKSAPGDCAPKPRHVVALLLEKNAPPVSFSGSLVVWAMPARNTHLVVCHLPGTDPSNPLNLLSLHVRDNRNFMKGMVIPPEKGAGTKVQVKQVSEWVFELLGQCPRWRGKW